MKTNRIVFRISEEDGKAVEKAVRKFHRQTGAKRSVSAMLRHVVKEYVGEVQSTVKTPENTLQEACQK
jgi:hypothetical protein